MASVTKMSNTWKRPDSVPFPSVWRRFQGAKTKREYWVQDITDEYMEQVIFLLCRDFLRDESLCKYSEPPSDELCVEEIALIWRTILAQGLGLLCLTKNDEGKEVIAGLNATFRVTRDFPEIKVKTEKMQKVFGAVEYMSHMRDPFQELNIDAYLSALGLLVLPEYRGENIGLEILKAREPMCRAVGIKASLTTFTGIASQTLAVKAGFKDFATVDYNELEKINPLFSFPGVTKNTKSLRHMYILYE